MKHVEREQYHGNDPEASHAVGWHVRPQRCREHHYDAEDTRDDPAGKRFGNAKLVQRHDEPEQPRNRELALSAYLAKLDDRRDEQRPANPPVDTAEAHCPFNPISISRRTASGRDSSSGWCLIQESSAAS